MNLRKIVGKIHLWLGLFSGIIVFIVSFTGAILVFEREIEYMAQPDVRTHPRYIGAQDAPFIRPSEFEAIFNRKYPGIPLSGVNYRHGLASVGWAYKDGPGGYYYEMSLDPYTGEETVHGNATPSNSLHDFFHFMVDGHVHLWLPEHIGKPIVGYATLVFFIMLITGIVLWWPRNKAGRKQRFVFRWKPTTKWKRKNYDLHNISGFYMSWVAVFISITGLVMAFGWFHDSWYFLLSGGKQLKEQVTGTYQYASTSSTSKGHPVDLLWGEFYAANPGYKGWLEIYLPGEESSEIVFRVDDPPKRARYYYYDRSTLEDVGASSSFADKVLKLNYSIHVGEIFELPTKILAFGASLIAASLPITGFLIWRGRKRKIKS